MKYVYLVVEQSNIDCEGYYGPSIQDVNITAFETKRAAAKEIKKLKDEKEEEYPEYEESIEVNGFFISDPDSDNFYSAEIIRKKVK